MKKELIFVLLLMMFFSCTRNAEKETIVKDLLTKEFNFCGMSNHNSSDYMIVSYIDSVGCVKCKLKLNEWKILKEELNTKGKAIQIVFIAHASVMKDLQLLLKSADFYPDKIVSDVGNQIQLRNKIPNDFVLQTFLLDEASKIILVGNPVHNTKIKDLYFKYIKQ